MRSQNGYLLSAQDVVLLSANGGCPNCYVIAAMTLSRGDQKLAETLRVVMSRGFRYESKKV